MIEHIPVTFAVLVLTSCAAWAQEVRDDPDVRTRQLWDTTLLSRRPPGPGAAPRKLQVKPTDDSLIGVTLWRLRPSKSSDEPGVRALIHEADGNTEWTPERAAIDTPLTEGQKARISIETARNGYLYVLDRDEYADGTRSDAYLIFPTLRTRAGDNRVSAGTVIEIPSAEDAPSYFTVRKSRPDQLNEVLTVLVSSEPIPGLRIGRERLKISDAQINAWENQWKARVYRLEAAGQAGKAYSLAEKNAGKDRKPLTQEDPLPQTMYRVEAKPGGTLLLKFPLQISK